MVWFAYPFIESIFISATLLDPLYMTTDLTLTPKCLGKVPIITLPV